MTDDAKSNPSESPARAGDSNTVVGASVAWQRPQLIAMKEAIRELAAIGPDNPNMPEIYFRDFIQELFNPETGTFNTSLWYHVVGEWRRGLNVTGPDGSVLFSTPPVISTIVSRAGAKRDQVTGKERPTIAQVANVAAMNGRRHPMLEARAMNDGLAHYKPEIAGGLEDAWKKILARYGLAKAPSNGKSGPTVDDLLSGEGELL